MIKNLEIARRREDSSDTEGSLTGVVTVSVVEVGGGSPLQGGSPHSLLYPQDLEEELSNTYSYLCLTDELKSAFLLDELVRIALAVSIGLRYNRKAYIWVEWKTGRAQEQ